MTKLSLQAAIRALLKAQSEFDVACEQIAASRFIEKHPSDQPLRDAAEAMRLAARHAPNSSVAEIDAAEGWLALWDDLEVNGPSDPTDVEATLAKMQAVI